MTSRSRFVSNAAALGTATAASTVFTLLQVKILASHLTQDGFGLFAALRGLSLLVSMVAANGLPQLLVRYLPVHESRGDVGRAVRLSVSCIVVATAATLALVAVVHLFRDEFMSSLPPALRSGPFLGWFYVTTLGVTLKLVLYGGFGGLRRLSSQTWIETVSLAVQVVWVFAARDRLDLTTLFMILGVVAMGGVLAGLPWFAVHLRRDVAADGPGAGEPVGYRAYWVGATGLSLVAIAFSDVDRYVLSSVLALEVLSLFHIASRVIRLSNRFIGIPVLAFQPEVSRVDAEGRPDAAEFSARVFLKFNVLVSLVAAVTIAVFSEEVIRAIANADYLAARPLLLLMAVSIPLTAVTAPLTAVMKSRDDIRRAFYCDLVWAASYVVLLLVLGRRLGLVGAGYAHVAACALQMAAAMGLCDLKAGGAVTRAMTRGLAACILVFGVPAAMLFAGDPGAIAVAVRVVLFGAGLAIFRRVVLRLGVFDAGERDRLSDMMRRAVAARLLRKLLP